MNIDFLLLTQIKLSLKLKDFAIYINYYTEKLILIIFFKFFNKIFEK